MNQDLLKLPKTAFFCSRTIPAEEILRTYDGAREQRKIGRCIITTAGLKKKYTDDREFWTDPANYDKGKNGTYVRLRLLKEKDSDKVKLAGLCAHGLSKALQAPIRVKAKLLEFLKQNFGE